MDRPGVRQVPEGNGEQGKMEITDCKVTCGAPTTLVVNGLMMIMMKLFNVFLERTMTAALKDHEDTISIEGRIITNFRFADDINGLAGGMKK